MTEDQFGPDTAVDDRWGEMFADVGHFENGAIPVDTVVRRGKGIRGRRRVVGGSALAVAAALSIGVPVAISGGSGTGYGAESGGSRVYDATSSGERVRVNPTPFSDGKGHFSGTVDGKPWKVDFDNKNCFYILWSCGFKDLYPWDKYGSLAVNASDNEPFNYTLFLKRNVSRVTVTLHDGEVLRLAAVPVFDTPVVLFAVPHGLQISRIDLFDAGGSEIAYTIPFSAEGSWSINGVWYLPGENPPAQAGSVDLARGVIGGEQVTITAYVGPSGACFVTSHSRGAGAGAGADPTCGSLVPNTATETFPAPLTGSHGSTNGGMSAIGMAAPNLDHLELRFADSTTELVPVKALGGYRFYAYIVPAGRTLTAVTGYDAAGKALPTGKNSW